MTTRKQMRREIARLTANSNYYGLQCDLLSADNSALVNEVKELRKRNAKLEEENGALLDAVAALCDKNKELVSLTKEQRLKIMSLEAMWGAMKRRNEDALSA